jgi:hypothetical protein
MPDLNTVSLAPRSGPYAPPSNPEDVVSVDAAGSRLAQITSEELVLIETFLQRRFDLDAVVRDQTAYQIAARITAKTGLRPGPEESREHFLEIVARQVRDTARLR